MSLARWTAALGGACVVACAGAAAAGPPALPLSQVDVSSRVGAEAETTVAVAPADPRVLLAGSNEARVTPLRYRVVKGRPRTTGGLELGTLAYTSTDGGATWTASSPFPHSTLSCPIGDPVTAIDDRGRELIGYLVVPCSAEQEDQRVSLYVSRRDGPAGAWAVVRVPSPTGPAGPENDKPAVAWDTSPASPHHGRAYLAWTRIARSRATVVISHSDDGGATWTVPAQVVHGLALGTSSFFASLAVSPGGDVYAAWTTPTRAIDLARSTDGGETFADAVTADSVPSLPGSLGSPCLYRGQAIPAQPVRCVSVNPFVVASAEHVYVTYAASGSDGHEQDIRVATLDPALTAIGEPVQLNPDDGELVSDQFQPVAALDPSTGLVWVCFYDSSGDSTRRSVRYACSASRDGVAWAPPLAVASLRSNENALYARRSFEFGDYQGLAIGSDGVAHPIWTDSRDLRLRGEEIYTTTLVAANLGY